VEVVLNNGATIIGKVIGRDEVGDLAIIKVERELPLAAPLGDSDALGLGDPVYAIGYPLGLRGGPSVTGGIFSARRRDTDTSVEMLQIDAPLNPGNSGGPIIDRRGQVVAIATSVRRQSGFGAVEGVSFGVSSGYIRLRIDQLKKGQVFAAAGKFVPLEPGPREKFRSPEYHYTIEYPKDWTPNTSIKVRFAARSPLGLAGITVVVLIDLPKGTPMEEFYFFVRKVDDFTQLSRQEAPSDIFVPGQQVRVFRVTYSNFDFVDGITHGIKYLFVAGDKGYILTGFGPAEDFDYYERVLDASLLTFRLLPEALLPSTPTPTPVPTPAR
jgi:hypothetical protein